jgi:hypothetical protein
MSNFPGGGGDREMQDHRGGPHKMAAQDHHKAKSGPSAWHLSEEVLDMGLLGALY